MQPQGTAILLLQLKEARGFQTILELQYYIKEHADYWIPEGTISRWLNGQRRPTGIFEKMIKKLIEDELQSLQGSK